MEIKNTDKNFSINIIIENLQDKIEVTDDMADLFRKTVEKSLEAENFGISSEVSILLVDNDKIKEMNKEYRNIDSPTDVLSFPMLDMVEGKLKSDAGDYDLDEGVLLLGDIVISMEKAQKQATEYGHSFERELAFLLTHGLFHLLGYDHETVEEEKLMLGKQEAILESIGLKRG